MSKYHLFDSSTTILVKYTRPLGHFDSTIHNIIFQIIVYFDADGDAYDVYLFGLPTTK